MAISLAALLGVPSLKLSKAGLAETTWHQDIVWVAVTEQEDPQRFLNGGELVLTTGMRLRTAPEQRRFVRLGGLFPDIQIAGLDRLERSF